jgi:hypothetical protein
MIPALAKNENAIAASTRRIAFSGADFFSSVGGK